VVPPTRTQTEIEQTLDALKPLALDLRRRGYDTHLFVEARGEGRYTVEVRVSVPPEGIPIESVRNVNGAAV
jgi:hypothetical protein